MTEQCHFLSQFMTPLNSSLYYRKNLPWDELTSTLHPLMKIAVLEDVRVEYHANTSKLGGIFFGRGSGAQQAYFILPICPQYLTKGLQICFPYMI